MEVTDNPFLPDPEFDKRFWAAWPRWHFINCWKSYQGLRSFCLLEVWQFKGGSFGLNLFNFAVEFNPHHKENRKDFKTCA